MMKIVTFYIKQKFYLRNLNIFFVLIKNLNAVLKTIKENFNHITRYTGIDIQG